MKQYPRIYSLSTIGLIHHREFDYRFHPFRTDFIGESGSGKSMIADLIQLIFVGSEAFESATKATGDREPEGMVLQSERLGKGVGYAFLNIETQPEKYLVIGTYMEAGNRSTQSFIIQKGFEWPNIQQLKIPVSYTDFLNGDDILSMDSLPDWLESKDLHIKSWHQPKEYHRILSREKILPLDLASSDRLLKDYAIILQSFSRGKMLDTQKNESLKKFLFGSLDAKRMLEQFQAAEKDMAQAIGEYGSNLREIDRITQKQRALLDLRDLKTQLDDRQRTWLYKKMLYSHQEFTEAERQREEFVDIYQEAVRKRAIVIDFLQDEMRVANERLPVLKRQRGTAENSYAKLLPQKDNIQKVIEWLDNFGCNSDELEKKFREYQQERLENQVLIRFIDSLKNKDVLYTFDGLRDKSSLYTIQLDLSDQVKSLKDVIRQKKSLKKYVNLNDPESLAYWALEQKRKFTLEEESVIVRFQDLPRIQPFDRQDYLPNPAELLENLTTIDADAKGFWINLSGVRRYIAYVKDQILNTTDVMKIRLYFELHTENIEKDITELQKQLLKYELLQTVLAEHDNSAIAAYLKKDKLLEFRIIHSFEISAERFHELLDTHANREVIMREYAQAHELMDSIMEDLKEAEMNQRQYEKLLNTIKIKELPEEVQFAIQETLIVSKVKAAKKEVLASVSSLSIRDITIIEELLEQIQFANKNMYQLPDLKKRIIRSQIELTDTKQQYQNLFGNIPETLASEEHINDPKDYFDKYFQAETRYNEKYKTIIEQYISTEAYRFAEDREFVSLAKNLLPEAFYEEVVSHSESSVIDAISSYLTRINDKNRQLNSRKIQKIRDLLDEVDELTTQQENTLRRIDNFLRKGAQITGGYTARLHKMPNIHYPKTWMSRFKELLRDEQDSSGLHKHLASKIDLENMMKEAFFQCGGSLSSGFTISKLLDPSSYYELSFKMESDSGRINKGSTGQTYAAIALLCIARLSIMSNEEGKPAEPAVRVMPIDEAEGLGSNYDMLYDIASRYDYQLISLSIGPVGKFKDGEQYLYMLHKNMEVDEPVNYTPVGILSSADKTPGISL